MHEKVCYDKSFLKEVIARIDFAIPLNLEKGPPTRFVNPVAKKFPIIEPTEIRTQQLALVTGNVEHTNFTEREWNYFSRDRDVKLNISPNASYIQYTQYKSYDELNEHFEILIRSIEKAFPETVVSRFGLRYINQIEIPHINPTMWGDYINDELIAQRNFFGADDVLTRLVSINELQQDEVRIRFQHGMPNPDFPAPIRRSNYVIDIDASVVEAHDLNTSIKLLEKAHTSIQKLFERSIKNKLREVMHVKPAVQ